ncbi:hypothetical protein M2263_001698 [Providencia alcalifaciens]|nr:hypothetical protein [Providencia alcalifaciens]
MASFNLTDLLGQSILSTIQLVYSPVEYFYLSNTIGDITYLFALYMMF